MGSNMSKRNLRKDPRLKRFLLGNARPTGRRIGSGSYGTVDELQVEGLLCAGKKLHDILVQKEYMGRLDTVEKFVDECTLLSDLRHPNIIQFLGICFLETSETPILVMEYLPYCLDSLLGPKAGADRLELSLAMKLSALRDVALGLAYLHMHTPPIIHRDLTAKNILLTSALLAKIVDLGVARILNLQPGRLSVTMTRAPGTQVYMPPEALEEDPKYNATIDMFAFGHLTLYTVVEDLPIPTAPTRPDPDNPGMVIGLTEIQRRNRHMKKLVQKLGGEKHPLVELVTQCLHNDPKQRPSAGQVLSQLEEMRAKIEDPYANMSKLELIQVLKRRGRREEEGGGGSSQDQTDLADGQAEALYYQSRVREVQAELQAKETELEHLQEDMQARITDLETSQSEAQYNLEEMERYQSQAERIQGQLQAKEEELESSRAEIQQLRTGVEEIQGQLQSKEAEVQQCRLEVQQCQSRIQQAEAELRSKEEEKQQLQAQLGMRVTEAAEVPKPAKQMREELNAPLSFKWKQGKNIAVRTAAAQALVLNGKVYVGIGKADCEDDQLTIQVYTPEAQQWNPLPKCPLRYTAMAVVDQQLVLVCEALVVWDAVSCQWIYPYPNIPSARDDPAAVGYRKFLVLAGGHNEGSPLMADVNILNSSNKQWLTASPLPVGCHGLTPATVGDTLYLLGGWSGYSPNLKMFSISLPALLSCATSTTQAKSPSWEVTDTELKHSTAVSLHNSLVTVGGEDDDYVHSSGISLYNPQTRQWARVGKMPVAQSQCACTILPSGELMVIGGTGEEHRRSNQVYIATVNM